MENRNKKDIVMEETKWIPGWEGHYKIDTKGNVYSEKAFYNFKKKIMRNSVNRLGYKIITLRRDGKSHTFLVHHLVMSAWGEPRPEENYQLSFIDGNKKNISMYNLKWIPSEEARLKRSIPIKAISIDDDTYILFKTMSDCAKHFRTHNAQIRDLCETGLAFRGYTFYFVNKKLYNKIDDGFIPLGYNSKEL